jgi:hypothetical protein
VACRRAADIATPRHRCGQPGILILLSFQSDVRKQGAAQLKSGGWIHGVVLYCEQKGVESPRFLPEISQNQARRGGFFPTKKVFECLAVHFAVRHYCKLLN